MKLEQFREIADENLQDLVVDERMLQRVHQKMNTVQHKRRPAIPRQAMALAAACIAVMLVSGGVLIGSMGLEKEKPADTIGVSMVVKDTQPANSASTLAAHTQTSNFADGTVLPYGIEEIGAYCEGFAPARCTNGLYGVVDQDCVWVIKAIYDDVAIQESGKAVVILQGAEQIIGIPVN